MPFIGTTPTQGFVSSFPKQSFTPNGSTTVFTLTNPVASANDLEVFVGNVRQEPTTAYTAAGTTLTMSEAPNTGLNFYVINKSFAQVTTTPPANSIATDKIVNSAVTDAKIGGMAASKLTGAMPALNGSALTNLTAVTELDVWYISANQSMSSGYNDLTGSYWTRYTGSSQTYGLPFEKIGTGMTQSSGVYTFPSTGKWRVDFSMSGYATGGGTALYQGGHIQHTTNNGSNWNSVTARWQNVAAGTNSYFSSHVVSYVDITDTSNQKIRFQFESQGITVTLLGSTYGSLAVFQKLGET